MAAAYAALVSLMHLIEQIQHHPRPRITLDNEQVESLAEKVAFLQGFLEAYNSHGGNQEVERLQNLIAEAAYAAEDVIESHIVDRIHVIISLQSRIADAAYAAEDIIESHVVDQLAQSTITYDVEEMDIFEEADGEKTSDADFYKSLQKVIEDMDFIKKEVMKIKDQIGIQDQLQRLIITTPAASSKSPSTEQSTMVGFDDVLIELLDKLTRQSSHFQIIPIVGMAGIGKTTLARNVYENQLIVQHFDIRAWITISREYNIREILLEALLCQKNQGSREDLRPLSEEELKEKLYRSLCGRMYLIIMDDIWSNDV